MPTKKRDAINIKTTYDPKGVDGAKKGIKSLNNASKEHNNTQKLNKISSEQTIAAVRRSTEITKGSLKQTTQQLKVQNAQMKTFKQTAVGKVVRGFVNILEKVAALVKYTGIAIVVFKVFNKLTEGGTKTLSQMFIVGTNQSGKLIHALGMIIEAVVELLAKTTLWGKVFKDGVGVAKGIKTVAENMKDIGYVTKKVSDTTASFGQIFKNIFKKDKVTGTLNIFRHLGNVIKNVGDVTIKAGTKLDMFGPMGAVIGAVVSKIGLGVKSVSQIVSKGIKVKSWDDFLDLLKKIGTSFLGMGTFKQILKDINNIPFLKPWLESFTQIGKYVLRFGNSLKTIGKSTFAKAIKEKLDKVKGAVKDTADKVKQNMDKATDPFSKMKAMFETLFSEMKNGFQKGAFNVKDFFESLKTGATKGFTTFTEGLKKGLGKAGEMFGVTKDKAKEFTSFLGTTGYVGIKAFLNTIKKADSITPGVFIKAALKAKIFAAAQANANKSAKKFANSFNDLRSKIPILDKIAGFIGRSTKGFRNAYNAGRAFAKIGNLLSNSIGALKTYLGIQKKIPKSFMQMLSSAAQSFRYIVFMFQTIGRWASKIVSGALNASSAWESANTKFNIVFGEFSDKTRAWAEDFSKKTNQNKYVLIDWLSTFQDTFVPLGFAREQAAGLSKQLLAVASHVGRFNNMATPDVMQAFSSAITGSHETVKQFGIIINEVTMGQELLKMGLEGGTTKATEQQKAMARLAVIMNSTTDAFGAAFDRAKDYPALLESVKGKAQGLSIGIGDSMKKMSATVLDAVSGVLEDITTQFDNSKEDVGKIFEDIGEAIATVVKNIYEAIKTIDFTKVIQAVQGLILLIGNIVSLFIRIVGIFSPFINFLLDVFNAIARFLGSIDAKLLAIILSLVVFINVAMKLLIAAKWIMGLVVIFKEVIAAVQALTIVQGVLNAVTAAWPILLIIAAVAGITAIVLGVAAATKKAKEETEDYNEEIEAMLANQAKLERSRELQAYADKTAKASLKELEKEYSLLTDKKMRQYLLQQKQLTKLEVLEIEYSTQIARGAWEGAQHMIKLAALISAIKALYKTPVTSEEASSLYGSADELYILLKRIEALKNGMIQLGGAMSQLQAYEYWGYESDLIEGIIQKDKYLIYLGSVQYQLNLSNNMGLKDRASIMQEIIDKTLQEKDTAEIYNSLLKTRTGLDAQLQYNAEEIAALTGETYGAMLDINNIRAWLLKNEEQSSSLNVERVKELAEQRVEYEIQLENLELTFKYWAAILKQISKTTAVMRDYNAEVHSGITKAKADIGDTVINADITRQLNQPRWEKILAITDLEQKSEILSSILKDIDFSELENIELKGAQFENLQAIKSFAEEVKQAYADVKKEMDSIELLKEVKGVVIELELGPEVKAKQDEIKKLTDYVEFLKEQGATEFKKEIDIITGEVERLNNEVTETALGIEEFGETVKSAMDELVESIPYIEEIKSVISKAAASMTPFVKLFEKMVKSFNDSDVGTAINGLIGQITDGLSGFFQGAGDYISKNFIEPLAESLKAVDDATGNIISGIGNGISDTISTLFESSGVAVAAFGGVLGWVIEQVVNLAMQTRALQEAFSFITQSLIQIVAPLADAIMQMLTPIVRPILAFVSMIATWLTPVFMGIGKLFERMTPLFNALGMFVGELLNAIAPLIPVVLQIVDLIGVILTPIVKALATPLSFIGDLLTFLQPILDALVFAFKILGTIVATIAGFFEWLGNIIHNFGKFVTNVINNLFDSSKWGLGMKEANLATIIAKNVADIWKNPETYEAFKPDNVDFNNLIDATNLDDYMTGWTSGLTSGSFDLDNTIQNAVVQRPPDVYNNVTIEGATVVAGLNDLRVVTIQDILDALQMQSDYNQGLNVVVSQ